MARVPTASRRRGVRLLVAAACLAALVGLAAAVLVSPGGHSSARLATRCDLQATPGSFEMRVAMAHAGQTICLAPGDYGTRDGTDKAITITGDRDRATTMTVHLGQGDSGFTLERIGGMGGGVTAGAANV